MSGTIPPNPPLPYIFMGCTRNSMWPVIRVCVLSNDNKLAEAEAFLAYIQVGFLRLSRRIGIVP